jgi:diaminopimelate decarboxylase
MTGFHYKQGIMHADDIPLSDIARDYGTPAYVYSANHIAFQYHALADAMKCALPPTSSALLCYACKANSNIAILSHLRKLGSGLEVVSGGELQRGLKAGFDPQKIVFTGVGKTRDEIALGLNSGIKQFNVESLPELHAIQQVAQSVDKTATVVFRLNPDVSGGGHHKISTGRKRDKFGIGHGALLEAFAQADQMSHVDAVGLSMHIGSQVFDVGKFREAFAKLPDIVHELRGKGYKIERLDIGGGFPIQYNGENLLDLDAYAQWVADFVAPLGTEIILEPGRYLVGNGGVLLSEVLYIKETQDRSFLIIDAAMNDLIRPTLYEAYHGIAPVRQGANDIKQYDIVGPICETGDTFSSGRELPESKQGDLVVIQSAGAYGMSMASNYNTRGILPEILVMGGKAHLIRRRQTVDDILAYESIPDELK